MNASTLLFLPPVPPCTAVGPRLRYPLLQATLLPPPLELLSPTLPSSISLKGSFVLTVLGPSVDVSVSLTVSDPTPLSPNLTLQKPCRMGKREGGWMNPGKGHWEGEGLKILGEITSLIRRPKDTQTSPSSGRAFAGIKALDFFPGTPKE